MRLTNHDMKRKQRIAGPVTQLGVTVLVGMGLTLSACQTQQEAPEEAAVQSEGLDAFAGPGVPQFEFDPTWPKIPLPNNWIFGNMAGVHVDENDHIWILQRGNSVQLDLGDDYLELGSAECCTPAPSVVEFDQEGNILQAWGGPDKTNKKADSASPSLSRTPEQAGAGGVRMATRAQLVCRSRWQRVDGGATTLSMAITVQW